MQIGLPWSWNHQYMGKQGTELAAQLLGRPKHEGFINNQEWLSAFRMADEYPIEMSEAKLRAKAEMKRITEQQESSPTGAPDVKRTRKTKKTPASEAASASASSAAGGAPPPPQPPKAAAQR